MSEDNHNHLNGRDETDEVDQEAEKKKRERKPHLVQSRPGRLVTIAGLVERVVSQFEQEHARESDALLEADTEMKRLKLVRDSAHYVLAVESVDLPADDRAKVIQQAYSELFGYGPLDALIDDEKITTIALEGADKVAVRYGPGDELTPLDPIFEDSSHMQRMIRRILVDAGAELREDEPIIETGVVHKDRRICLNLVGPPITIQLTADIRVHPRAVPTLEDWAAADYMPEEAVELLRAIARSSHGMIIVGDTESGKTTLMATLARQLDTSVRTVAVERAGELSLPDSIIRQVVAWPVGEKGGVTFHDRVQEALETSPECLLVDEIRADELDAIKLLLSHPDPLRQIWTFRGSAESARIRAALGMIARRADVSRPEAMAYQLYKRLPFVITMKKRRGKLELQQIGEWQIAEGAEYPDYVELMTKDWAGLRLTGKQPALPLELPQDFWSKS